MTATRRVFVLLGVYEDLTERVHRALKREDVDHAFAVENRRERIVQALGAARRNAELSETDIDALSCRVRTLHEREKENIALLQKRMARVRAEISELNFAVKRTRQIRRGYAGRVPPRSSTAGSMLGCA